MNSPRTRFHSRLRVTWACACLATLIASAAMAQSPPLVVRDAWVRQTPGSDVAAVYMTLRNESPRAITVTGVQSPLASHAMIHESKTEGGQSKMRPHEHLVIPPGQTVKLEPGGLHVMLHGLSQPVAVGQNLPLVLRLDDGTNIDVAAQVRPLNSQ
jgi:periplasmic copper chaperone A